MRPGHLLLVFLILVALGAHAYVTLEYNYRDAPQSVKYALGLGFAAAAVLLAIVGKNMVGRKRGNAPIIIPALLAVLAVMAGIASPLAHASTTVDNKYIVEIRWDAAPDIHEIDYPLCNYSVGGVRYTVYLHGSTGTGGWANPRFSIDVRKNMFVLPIKSVSLMPNTTIIKIIEGWETRFIMVENETGTYVKTREWHRICPHAITLKPGTYRIDSNAIMIVKQLPHDNTSNTSTSAQQAGHSSLTPAAVGLGVLAGLILALASRGVVV